MAAGFDKYIKASAKRPAKKISGGVAVVATSTVHGPGQSRCMRCHGMCGAKTGADGKPVMRCDSCGYTFTTKPL